jgi:hypothetical protein
MADHSLLGIVLDFKTALYIAMASDHHLPHIDSTTDSGGILRAQWLER